MHCHMFRIVPCEECQVDVLQKDKVSWPGEVEKKSARWPNFCPTTVVKLSIWYWIFWPPVTTISMQSINGFQRHSPFNARKGNYLFFNLFGVWKQLFFYGCPQLIWQYNGNFPFLKYNTFRQNCEFLVCPWKESWARPKYNECARDCSHGQCLSCFFCAHGNSHAHAHAKSHGHARDYVHGHVYYWQTRSRVSAR